MAGCGHGLPGANTPGSRFPVGKANVDFAFWCLGNDGTPFLGQDLGGRDARRLHS